MCGIFGIVVPDNEPIKVGTLRKIVKDLFLLSESRGKEAAGLAVRTGEIIYTLKCPVSASELVRSTDYDNLISKAAGSNSNGIFKGGAVIGHSRMVTCGSEELHDNNQPVIRDGIVGIHNGIVVNDKRLWERYPQMKRMFDVDSEVILSLMNIFYKRDKLLCRSFAGALREIEGYASVALMFSEFRHLLIGTNNGSLYCVNRGGIFIFCSEELMLKRLIGKRYLRGMFAADCVRHVEPGNAYLLNIASGETVHFGLDDERFPEPEMNGDEKIAAIVDGVSRFSNPLKSDPLKSDPLKKEIPEFKRSPVPGEVLNDFEYSKSVIGQLKRCTRCILPETMPFIEFGEEGVCNYCRDYKKKEILGEQRLVDVFKKYRGEGSRPDCIVMLSGGRDSSYMLYYVREILKMNPVAYTYDWGMVTDLARRNISRLCGKLGVEHLLISADINKKRKYIRENVLAWLKKPHIGMIPLFMAGDKIYFQLAHKLRRDLGIELILSGRNTLENTYFKHGFSGVKENYKTKPYELGISAKMKVAKYYAGQFLRNPAYWNGSLVDSLTGYLSAYFLGHDYIFFYDYIKWDENRLIGTLKEYFDWETASDTDTTWRIGDGTASFYNYIYYTVAGISELDTFQSNKIRAGEVTREEALRVAENYNQPRFESIEWYCKTIGIDFTDTVRKISRIPKLYKDLRRG